MSNPLVSIVIPVYNQGVYLDRTIRSVLSQDYAPVECIVIDDGSTDDSLAVAQRHGHRITLMHQPNAGQANALNNGFALARGDFVGYLSSDDTIDPTWVSHAMAHAEALPSGPVVIFPKYRTIDPQDAVMGESCPEFAGVQHMVECFRCNIGPGALFSREVLQSVAGWNPAYRQIPDYDFWLRVARVATFHQLPYVLASFRVHPGSQTYASCSTEKADESIRLVAALEQGGLPLNTSFDGFRASAHLYSACLHLRSARFGLGGHRYAQALRFSLRSALGWRAAMRATRSMATGVSRCLGLP